jgi:dienelactone hydrolase
MKEQWVEYEVDGVTCEGFLALPDGPGPFPGVVVCHNWLGQNDNERAKARELAALGYAAFAADLYGKGRRATDQASASALMTPLANDRAGALARRTHASVATLAARPEVAADRIGAIGFCFGGLCVLDLARSAAPVRCVVSFHGLLGAHAFPGAAPTAAVLVLHGYDDPMAKPEQLVAFCGEMTALGLDWQAHAYGHTVHAFSTPGATDAGFGTVFSERANRRSFASMRAFLAEHLAAPQTSSLGSRP